MRSWLASPIGKVNFLFLTQVVLQLGAGRLPKSGSSPPRRPGHKGAIYFHFICLHFKEKLPGSLRKTVLVSKTHRKILKRFTSQRDREGTCKDKFPKVNTLRNGGFRSLELGRNLSVV